MPTSLPPSVFEIVEFTPLEEIVLELIRARITSGVNIQSLVEDDQSWPAVLVRRTPNYGFWAGDGHFIDSGQITVHTFADGIDADSDCALLADAVRVILRDSVNVVIPSVGHLTSVQMTTPPRRVTDWATATGPVQYADLPTGVVRYEAVFELAVKVARTP